MQFLIELTNVVLNVRSQLAEGVTLVADAGSYLAGAWAAWLAAGTIAELLLTSPRIPDQSLDVHMLRLAALVVGLFAVAARMFHGASQIGLPFYGVSASVGVGGLALALAARTTLEDCLEALTACR
jgi:MscS family membrane protein